MINQILFVLAANERGGLFDFGATLPLVALEFLLLMLVLNLILYTPLFKVMNQRKEYIMNNLSKANDLLQEVENLTTLYEKELAEAKIKIQKKSTLYQKQQKESFNEELNKIISSIDNLLNRFLNNFTTIQVRLLEDLTGKVESLSQAIYSSLFIS